MLASLLTFAFSLLYTLITFLKEFLSWVNKVTDDKKSTIQKILGIFWNLIYIILGLISLIPIIVSLEALVSFKKVICIDYNIPCARDSFVEEIEKSFLSTNGDIDPELCQKLRDATSLIKFNYDFPDDRFKTAIIVVRTFAYGWIIRIFIAVLAGVNKSYKKLIRSPLKKFRNLTFREMILKPFVITYELFKIIVIYVSASPIYNCVPFAGGTYRSALNAALLSLQYILIFISTLNPPIDNPEGSSRFINTLLRQKIYGPDFIEGQISLQEWSQNEMKIPVLGRVD